jgi:protein phosphatase methylesterase 1
MSQLQKSVFKSKLQALPEDVSMSHIMPAPAVAPRRRRQQYELKPWSDYFAQNFFYPSVERGVRFNVYYTPPVNGGPIFVFHHGAGAAALSFAALAQQLRDPTIFVADGRGVLPGFIAYDARGHGLSEYLTPPLAPAPTQLSTSSSSEAAPAAAGPGEEPEDYSLETLTADFVWVLNTVLADPALADPVARLDTVSLILVGHSLGGSVVSSACSAPHVSALAGGRGAAAVTGVAVLDVVEGSALDSLATMNSIINSIPTRFDSREDAVDWHVRTMALRNKQSACVSVPPLLVPLPATMTHTCSNSSSDGQEEPKYYGWKMDLRKTAPFWRDWFAGLSTRFLTITSSISKLLILAGTDRLDKELMIGQMQGKYQLVVYQDSGHFVHEDVPSKCALTLYDFWERNDRNSGINTARLKIVPKFGTFNS